MNCPRCNYPINKGIVWSNCPKCNCRLDRDAAPAQRVKVPQSKTPSASATRNVYSSSTNHFEDEYHPRRVAEQKQPKIAYCMNCGQKIEEGEKFCFKCGSAKFVPNKTNPSSMNHRKVFNKKVLIPFGSILLFLLIVTVVLVLNNTPKEVDSSQPSISNAEIVTPTETTIDVNFDLNAYDDHGNLSCGLIWLKKDNWYENLDKSITEFAYFDINGNQVSDWFKWEDYYKNDFSNNYLVLHKTSRYKGYVDEDTRLHYIYDTKFNTIAIIESISKNKGQIVNPVTDFNEYGYAFAYGFDATNGESAEINVKGFGYKNSVLGLNLLFIDKNGAHILEGFKDHEMGIYRYDDIITTEKYFIIGDDGVDYHCVYNHEGKLLLDPVSVLNENKDFSKNYTAKSGEVYNFQIDNNGICSFSFYAVNNQSNVQVKFSCKMDLNGNILSGPEKLQNQD